MENEKNLKETKTMTDAPKRQELNEKELENATGGKIEWAPAGAVRTGSGKTVSFCFNVGDRVEVNACIFGTERGTIVERKVVTKRYSPDAQTFGVDHDMPVYRIQFDKPSYRTKYADEFWDQNYLSY